MNITTPPDLLPPQTSGRGILETELMNSGTIENYTYSPLLTSYSATGTYNSQFQAWNQSMNVTANVTIDWPSGVLLPASGSPIIDSTVDNVHIPTPSNFVTQTINE